MRLLLDTHILLWWHSGDRRLEPAARGLIADPGNHVAFSVASLWEIVVKVRIGKLEADLMDVIAASEADGFRRLDVAIDHLDGLTRLAAHHRDPFDHLLVAQAIRERLVLVTADRRMELYPVETLLGSAAV